GLLSDARYAEQRARTAERRGWGPMRLQQDLRTAGVAPELAAPVLATLDRQGAQRARAVRIRRFGRAVPEKAEDTARQIRFLRGRGFTSGQIRYALELGRDDDFGVGVDDEQ
ncbi:MAG TPA: regulatory protein RecX, partial [Acidiferrobacteraceae bacterium]|nr:regulatory protein RecX [Acidiferrobacteraceae bacterium]